MNQRCNQTELILVEEPSLFLLGIDEPTVFIPVGKPFRFSAHFKDKKVYMSTQDGSTTVYSLPGIKRINGSLLFGFLLIDKTVFGKVCELILNEGKSKTIEVIFINAPFSLGEYKIYKNPPSEVDESILKRAEVVLSDPESFLIRELGVMVNGDFDRPPFSINLNTAGGCLV